ncbi:MAG: type II toxin-antitoxin system HigB family toxin [Candidatus Sericytochromatia bacterium]|nr:type II toxin-antitoxin system HigB family toxin [Candidatus Sericytochromatia bacterium]
MHIISRRKLADFFAANAAAQKPLEAWFKIVSQASWSNFVELRQTFPSADLVGRLTVFNLGGNKFRLIAKVTYRVGPTNGTVFLRSILTHAEYDKGGWKHDPWL